MATIALAHNRIVGFTVSMESTVEHLPDTHTSRPSLVSVSRRSFLFLVAAVCAAASGGHHPSQHSKEADAKVLAAEAVSSSTALAWNAIPPGTSLINQPVDFGSGIGVFQLSVCDNRILLQPDCLHAKSASFAVTHVETFACWLPITPELVAANRDAITLEKTEKGALLCVSFGVFSKSYDISEYEVRIALQQLTARCSALSGGDPQCSVCITSADSNLVFAIQPLSQQEVAGATDGTPSLVHIATH